MAFVLDLKNKDAEAALRAHAAVMGISMAEFAREAVLQALLDSGPDVATAVLTSLRLAMQDDG